MGLGKTLQVIAFIDIFLRYTPAKKVLCVVPINTIHNWMVEFNMWLPAKPENVDNENQDVESEEDIDKMRYRNFDVHQLGENNKTTIARAKVIGRWNQNGGVLLIGYELYRILTMSTPCMASNKCAPPKKKKSNNTSSNQEPEVIDLDEEE
jgi:RAD54-like protein 2